MKILITGGAGFIGRHAVQYFLGLGHKVVVIDDLSRGYDSIVPAITLNLGGLESVEQLDHVIQHMRPDAVIHLAGQTAVTTSLERPLHDFAVNAFGTLNLLEAVRLHAPDAVVVFASTNKVYGDLGDIDSDDVLMWGIDEGQPVSPATPYGCSKAAADQYVQDYSRTYGLKTVVFRCSCIYGADQRGTADQGWVSHFARCFARNEPITIYGDGTQVRDVLYVEDLCRAFEAAITNEAAHREVFNIGGGPLHTLSLKGALHRLTELAGTTPKITMERERSGDQRAYVSDLHKIRLRLGWEPRIGVDEGLARLWRWARDEAATVKGTAPAPTGRPAPSGRAS